MQIVIKIFLKLNSFIKGTGIWKFNTSLLKTKDNLDLDAAIIVEEKFKYTLPVYSSEFVKNMNNDLYLKIKTIISQKMYYFGLWENQSNLKAVLKQQDILGKH